jgi:hypothetical protein
MLYLLTLLGLLPFKAPFETSLGRSDIPIGRILLSNFWRQGEALWLALW